MRNHFKEKLFFSYMPFKDHPISPFFFSVISEIGCRQLFLIILSISYKALSCLFLVQLYHRAPSLTVVTTVLS